MQGLIKSIFYLPEIGWNKDKYIAMYSSQLIFVVFFVMGKIRHHLVFLSQITAFYKGGNIIFLIGHYKM